MTPSQAEIMVARSAREVLSDVTAGGSVGTSLGLRDLLGALERLTPEVLFVIYPEWEYESLDGVLPAWVRCAGKSDLEVLGLAILMSDQTVAPIFARVQPSVEHDRLAEVEIFLGHHGADGMIRTPYAARDIVLRPLLALSSRPTDLDWCYRAHRRVATAGLSD